MKQTIIAVLMFIFALTASSQTKDTTSKTPLLDKTEHLVDKYSAKIADGFVSVIEQSKPMAKEAFQYVVMLQIAKGIALLLPLLAFIVFSVMFFSEYKRIDTILKSDNIPNHMNGNYGPMDEQNITPKIIFSLIGVVSFCTVSCLYTYSDVLHLIAPKWYAVKEIIELFK